jgi:hypothetical protein
MNTETIGHNGREYVNLADGLIDDRPNVVEDYLSGRLD